MTAELRRSPLAGLLDDVPGVREIPFRTVVNLRAAGPCLDRLGAALGISPPGPNRVATAGERAILWLGPDEWLVLGGDVEPLLREALGTDHGSIVDVSADRTTVELSGPHAREVLEKGVAIDLHPRAFGPGQCAQTLLARAQVILRQVDDEPTYHVLVRGSFAPYLADWLVDATREFR